MEVIEYGGPPIAKTQHYFEEQVCDYPEKYTIWHPVYTGGSIGKNDGRSSPSVPYTIGTIDEGGAYNCHPGRTFSVTRSVYPAERKVVQASEGSERTSGMMYMLLACMVCWCCNPLFGLIAFFLALHGTTSGEYNRHKTSTWLQASLWVSLIGVVVSIVLLIILVPLLLA